MNQGNGINGNQESGSKPYDKNNSNKSKGNGYKKPYPYAKKNKVNSQSYNSGSKPKGNKTKEEIADMVMRRNKALKQFFKSIGINIRIIGNENTPAIVYADKYILNAYVHNFELRFTDAEGTVIYTVKLSDSPVFDTETVLDYVRTSHKKEVYRVSIVNSTPTMYLAGFNYLNREEKSGRYPMFAAHFPNLYFSKEKTDEICEELNKEGNEYNVQSC